MRYEILSLIDLNIIIYEAKLLRQSEIVKQSKTV